MPTPTTHEIHSAIAALVRDSEEPIVAIASRLGVSVSTVRRALSAHGIVRRPRLGAEVLERIEAIREGKSQ